MITAVSSDFDALGGLKYDSPNVRESSICFLSLSDGTIERQHSETITAWTCAKLQAPDQIQGKVLYAYHDSIQVERKKTW